MDYVSAAKGVFGVKCKYTIGQKRRQAMSDDSTINEPWYHAYKNTWSIINDTAQDLNINMFKQMETELQNYLINVRDCTIDNFSCEIPTAILLSGVNLTDHGLLFNKLALKLSTITDKIAIIDSRDSINMKNLIEEIVFQLINSTQDDDDDDDDSPAIKKHECNLRLLKIWHLENCTINTPLVIIIREFESFNLKILGDLILILSSYTKTMKFVLLFDVATTLHAVHKSLTYDVTSKLRVQVFHTETQVKKLSEILLGTVLSHKIPLKLTRRAFPLITEIFLYYDFSVHCFLQGYKLCMIHHFYANNNAALCCEPEEVKKIIAKFTDTDIIELRKLPSIVNYLEKNKEKYQDIMLNDKKFKNLLLQLIDEFKVYMSEFLIILKFLHSLTSTLPKSPMGKELREIYSTAVTCNLITSQSYKDSYQLMGFLAKEELMNKLENFMELLNNTNKNLLVDVKINLKKHIKLMKEASNNAMKKIKTVDLSKSLNRMQLKENLLNSAQKQSQTPFRQAQINLMQYLDEVFTVHLINPNLMPAYELCCFSNSSIVKRHLIGSLRAASYTALNHPQVYLNCDCCKLDNDDTIQQSLPDINIIYKLHMESKKLINMYDWLQGYLTIVNPNDEADEQREIDPALHARFSQSVAELQFLGYIKISHRKTDHVKRLT